MILFYSPTSPFARKVRVLIAERQLTAIELVAASPFDAPSALTGANPLSKVPALVRDDGTALYDSPVICEFLDDCGGGERLLPPSGEARWDMLRRQALADGMMDTTLALALEVNRRPEHERSPDWIAHWVRTLARAADALGPKSPHGLPGSILVTSLPLARSAISISARAATWRGAMNGRSLLNGMPGPARERR